MSRIPPVQAAFQGIVYLAICRVNGKKYVGQTFSNRVCSPKVLLERRRNKHLRATQNGSNIPFHCALRKHGQDTFRWTILGIYYSLNDLNKAEIYFIELNRSLCGFDGYNAHTGGDNHAVTSVTRQKMSDAAKARWADNDKRKSLVSSLQIGRGKNLENIRKTSMASAKKHLHKSEVRYKARISIRRALNSDNYKAKRSLISLAYWSSLSEKQRKARTVHLRRCEQSRKRALLNVVQSAEYRRNMSTSVKARYAKPFVVFSAKTHEMIGLFQNKVDAAQALHVNANNITACLHGQAKTFGFRKYYARYLQD